MSRDARIVLEDAEQRIVKPRAAIPEDNAAIREK
jgi:hypothetical protein